MRLLSVVSVFMVACGFLLIEEVVGQGSQDIESILEEALKRLRESQESEADRDSDISMKTDIAIMASNLTLVLEDLTEAIKNNTIAMKKKKMMHGADGDGDGEGGESPGRVKCERPFFSVKGECFYVNKYKRVSWSEARNFCKGLGSDLAEPSRVNSLRAMLLDKFPENVFKFFWVGAMEASSEGNWTWLSSRPVQASDWATGQPDGGNENCVVLSRDDYPPLHDSPCYTHTMFICERLVLHRQ